MAGPNLRRMAWRNIWRNRLRTAITLCGIGFGVLLAVIFTGTSDWRWKAVIDLAASMGGGHISLQHPAYLDQPAFAQSVGGTDALARLALAEPAVARVTPRITGFAMLATATQNLGATLTAFDPAQEDATTFALFDSLHEGKMFATAADKGIILGQKLAENLDTGMGRKVVYTLTHKSGEIVTGMSRVTGIVRTGAPSVDASLCLLAIDSLRPVIGYAPDEATTVAVFLRDHRDTEAVTARLNTALAGRAMAHGWATTQPDLAGFIAMKVGGLQVMGIFMLLLITAGIFITLFVSVTERLREFGVLMAIGFSPLRLFRLVLWESVWLGLVGLASGALVTVPLYYLLKIKGLDLSGAMGEADLEIAGAAMEPILRVDIYPENAVAVGLAILLATVLSGLYPAWRAGRVVPVDSIKLV